MTGLRYGQTAVDNGDGSTTVSGQCYVTKQPYSVTVSTEGLHQWVTGYYAIQDALPNSPRGDREFLLSGTSPAGWQLMFPDE